MYRHLLVTLLISFFIMYAAMFLNVDEVSHIYLSLTRLYMSLLMVAPMALLMLLSMKKMYQDKRMNVIIGGSAIVVFILALIFLRGQAFISDKEYMQAMIPHHSSAIMTSKHASLQDPEVKKLAAGIIESQQREIREMKQIISRMK